MSDKVDAYIAALDGWQADTAKLLRQQIAAAGDLAEDFKWGHPMWSAGGAVCLFKSFKSHMTFAFWRGAQLTDLDPRLEPGGSFNMAAIKLTGPDQITSNEVGRLVAAAIALNREHGDPMKTARA
ncbi:MAG: DUF1801 domain-containing protein [Pseudomonadota bacterium]|uniref:DUF1801 domain-containing protein n=1 Tax=Phenylobacterium sp. TaxID=1871053 RepID=UPI0025FECF85|nr:DUF1801 domain-containing protein [Phenylobacterium sp.]MBT9471641.1 DUF1801 domain-containing protein [Phenylobacterium sp.]